MVMLVKLLGPDYEVWDKAATIRFFLPGRSTLHACFRISENVLAAIREVTADKGVVEQRFSVEMVDTEGLVHASCEKVLSIRSKLVD